MLPSFGRRSLPWPLAVGELDARCLASYGYAQFANPTVDCG
jgi:hypothetical protein